MLRRCLLLIVLAAPLALTLAGCSHHGSVVRSGPPGRDEGAPPRVNNSESPAVERWSGGG